MRVFVASTVSDLRPYREAAKAVILHLGLEPELVGPLPGLSDEEVVQICQAKLRRCAVCVLIVGFHRGGIPNFSGASAEKDSFTSFELDAAEAASIPVLAFLLRDGTSTEAGRLEAEKWVKSFRDRQSRDRVIAWVNEIGEFQVQLHMALARWLQSQSGRSGANAELGAAADGGGM